MQQFSVVDPRDFACILCFDLKGVIVRTNIGWVHLTCVNWIPEIWFNLESGNTIVEGKLEQNRSKLPCSYCKGKHKKKVGASCI